MKKKKEFREAVKGMKKKEIKKLDGLNGGGI
jgi:hypothetical protein